jgi:SAM-dependent methyltransferase
VSSQRCRACGLSNPEFLFQIGDNRVARCRGCTHVFLETFENGANNLCSERIDQEVISHLDDYLRTCREHCKTGSRALRLLAIGCRSEALLSRAKEQGFVTDNIETPLSESRLSPEKFDVITMYDLVEHLQDPIQDLRRVQFWLKPGGVLFVLTPNEEALPRRVARLAFRLSFRRIQRPLSTLYYAHHLSYFTTRSLRSLFEGTGFDTVRTLTRNQAMGRSGSGGKLLAWARRRA